MHFLLFPFSITYRFITTFRNLLFDYGVLKSKTYKIPIICIGNLSVGGTGKTPHTQYIINLLKSKYKIAILSRGYGRKGSALQYVKETSEVSLVGDEPLQIKKNSPNCLVVVEKNRNKGVQQILKDYPETQVILLDDGYQHRWIKAGLNILITPYANPYYKDYYMPIGNLRESKESAKRANIIIFSKTPEKSNPTQRKGMIQQLHLFAHQQAYFSSINYSTYKCIKTNKEYNSYNIESITLVTGIANCTNLVQHLKEKGHTVNHIEFADHHNYNHNNINDILQEYNKDSNTKKLILTTEKDAIKLKSFKKELNRVNVYYIPIEIDIKQKEKFDKQILDYVAKN